MNLARQNNNQNIKKKEKYHQKLLLTVPSMSLELVAPTRAPSLPSAPARPQPPHAVEPGWPTKPRDPRTDRRPRTRTQPTMTWTR